jgi:hypothetical protein
LKRATVRPSFFTFAESRSAARVPDPTTKKNAASAQQAETDRRE